MRHKQINLGHYLNFYKRIGFVFFFFTLLVNGTSFGNNINNLNTTEILKNNSFGIVKTIHYGEHGFWIGGENGLYKVLGEHVELFGSDKAPFNGAQIEDIFEDKNGNVWISTFGQGIVFFDTKLKSFSLFELVEDSKFSYCSKLVGDKNGYIIGLCSSGVLLIDSKSRKTDILFSGHSSDLVDFALDGRGEVWLLDESDNILKFSISNESEPLSVQFDNNQHIYTLNSDAEGNIWLGTDNGLFLYNKSKKKFLIYEEDNLINSREGKVTSIFTDNHGDIWFFQNGLYRLDVKSWGLTKEKHILNFNDSKHIEYINDMAFSRNNTAIISVPLHGLIIGTQFQPALSKLEGEKFGITNLESTLLLKSGNVLLASNEAVFLWDLKVGNIVQLENEVGYVTAMFQMQNGCIVMFSDTKGIFSISEKSQVYNATNCLLPNFDASGGNVYDFAEINAKLYFGVLGGKSPGVYVIDKEGVHLLLGELQIDNLLISKNNYLVVSTQSKGVIKFDLSGNLIKEYRSTNYPSNCMLEDSKENIWLCFDGGGLGVISKNSNEIQYLSQQVSNNSRFIRDLVEDDLGFLWGGTNAGLFRLDVNSNVSIKLGMEEGFHDSDYEIGSSLNLGIGKILVAGDNINYIVNTNLAKDFIDQRAKSVSEVIFTDLNVSTHSISTTNSDRYQSIFGTENPIINISHDDYLFSISFAVNNFLEKDILTFSYRLKGLNDDWFEVSSKNAEATYSTLPSGDYEFQVKVIDPKSTATQPISSLKITVLPPFWLTWQAYIIYALCLVLIAFLAYRIRVYKLRQLNDFLEVCVKKRTSELDSSNIKVSNLLKEKRLLFQNMSHEFRTPLSLVLGPIKQLVEQLKEAGNKSKAITAFKNASRLNVLIDQVVDLIRLDDDSEVQRQLYSINSSVTELIEMLKPLGTMKFQKFELKLCRDGKLFLTKDSLEKIVTNLVSNASKYSPQNATIKISSEVSNTKFILTVEDNGPGIVDSDKQKVFERFIRLNRGTNEPGSGLGLAVVKEIVELNNGTISIEDGERGGCKFIVSLPLANEEQLEFSDGVISSSKNLITPSYVGSEITVQHEEIESYSGHSVSVLVVEDNDELRNFICNSLSKFYVCESADNGNQGIEKAMISIPDVIVSDVLMPEKDGFDLVHTLRANSLTAHIPIILITAMHSDENRLQGWRENVDDFIPKPFSVEELRLRITRLLAIRDLVRKRHNKIIADTDNNGIRECVTFTQAKDQSFFEGFCKIIEEHYQNESFNRSKAASLLAISERQLNRKLGALIDYNFVEYLRKYRLEKAKELILSGGQITEISFDVGFSSPSYFSNCFKAEFGYSPSEFLEINNGQNV